MMGAAMLKRHRFVQFLWRWPKCVRGGVRRSPCFKVYKPFSFIISNALQDFCISWRTMEVFVCINNKTSPDKQNKNST